MTLTTILAFVAAFASLSAAAVLRLSGNGKWVGFSFFGLGLLMLGTSKMAEARGAAYAELLAWGGIALMVVGNWLFYRDRKRDVVPGGGE